MFNMLKLSGLFVCLEEVPVPGGTEKIYGLWLARGIITQTDTMIR